MSSIQNNNQKLTVMCAILWLDFVSFLEKKPSGLQTLNVQEQLLLGNELEVHMRFWVDGILQRFFACVENFAYLDCSDQYSITFFNGRSEVVEWILEDSNFGYVVVVKC